MSTDAGVRMEVPSAEMIADLVRSSIRVHDMKRPRSIQSQEGLLGPSSLGFCRQQSALMTKQVPQSDARSMWPAVIGTALGEYIEQGLHEAFPGWQVGSVTHRRVEHTFPSGATYGGTPDIVIPSWNAVFDLKTKSYLADFTDDIPLDNATYQQMTIQAFFDGAASTDASFTVA